MPKVEIRSAWVRPIFYAKRNSALNAFGNFTAQVFFCLKVNRTESKYFDLALNFGVNLWVKLCAVMSEPVNRFLSNDQMHLDVMG